MAPTKSTNRKTATAQRKTSRRKSSAATQPRPPKGKENATGSVNNSRELSSSPHDDNHEENWWALNVQKAVQLIERCMKAYNWERTETKRILNSYRQFLVLKKEHADWEATQLTPCWPVDRMWFEHGQMEDYDYDMRNLLGHVVNRTPAVEVGTEEKARQDDATKNALKQTFGSYDEELWTAIQVSIRDQMGKEESIEINRWQPFSSFLDAYAQKKEEAVELFRFECDGKTITGEDTPLSFGIDDNGEIEANHIDKVAVIIKQGDDESSTTSYLVEKTDMMSKTFDIFAKDVLDVDRAKIVFLYEEGRIFGYESPQVLKLNSRGNVINAVSVESYKCCNCIECSGNVMAEDGGASNAVARG